MCQLDHTLDLTHTYKTQMKTFISNTMQRCLATLKHKSNKCKPCVKQVLHIPWPVLSMKQISLSTISGLSAKTVLKTITTQNVRYLHTLLIKHNLSPSHLIPTRHSKSITHRSQNSHNKVNHILQNCGDLHHGTRKAEEHRRCSQKSTSCVK